MRPDFRAGLSQFRIGEKSGGRLLPLSVWYPTLAPETAWRHAIYDLSAAFDAEPAPGRHGLIAISHGSGGGDLNHHDWAEALARAGYVVVAPRHLGDRRGFRSDEDVRRRFLDRPRQLRMAVEAVRGHGRLGPHVDAGRLGVMGFSAGGCTCLNAVGVCPDFSLVVGDDGAPRSTIPPAELRESRLPGIRAAVLFAPFARIFSPDELSRVSIPLRVYRAEKESVAPNPRNADLVANHVPGVETATVAGDHFVFMAPVPEDAAARYPEYYRDAAGVDRRAIHARIAGELRAFFDRHLSLAGE